MSGLLKKIGVSRSKRSTGSTGNVTKPVKERTGIIGAITNIARSGNTSAIVNGKQPDKSIEQKNDTSAIVNEPTMIDTGDNIQLKINISGFRIEKSGKNVIITAEAKPSSASVDDENADSMNILHTSQTSEINVAGNFKVGDKVVVEYTDKDKDKEYNYGYSATISTVNSKGINLGTYDVKSYDDKEIQGVDPRIITKVDPNKDISEKKVVAIADKGVKEWYLGQIITKNHDNTYNVKFNDDVDEITEKEENNVPASRIIDFKLNKGGSRRRRRTRKNKKQQRHRAKRSRRNRL